EFLHLCATMQLQINPRGICSAIALLTFVCVSAATAPNGYLGCIELSSLSSAVTAGAVSISNWKELPTPAACFYRCSALGQARPLLGRSASCSCAKIEAGKSWTAAPGDPILSAIGAGRCEPCPNRPQLMCGSAASIAAMYSANRLLPSGKIFVNLTSRARQFERANLSLAIAMIGDFDNNISEFKVSLKIAGQPNLVIQQPLLRHQQLSSSTEQPFLSVGFSNHSLIATLQPVFVFAGPLNFSVEVESADLGPLAVAHTDPLLLMSEPFQSAYLPLSVTLLQLGYHSNQTVESAVQKSSTKILVKRPADQKPVASCSRLDTPHQSPVATVLFTKIVNQFSVCSNNRLSILSAQSVRINYRFIDLEGLDNGSDVEESLDRSVCDGHCCNFTYTATRPGSKVVQIEFNYGKNSEFANLIINLVSQSVANVTMRLLSDHGSKFAFTNNIIVYKLDLVTNLVFKTNNSKSLSVELKFLPESVNQMVSKKWTAIDYDRIGCLASAQVAVNFTGKLGFAVTPMLLVSGHSGLLTRFLADPVSVHSNLAIAIATIQGPSIAMINSHPSVVANYTVVAKLDDVTRIDWSLLRLLPSNDQSLNNPVFRHSIGNNKSASIELIANHGTSGGRFLITCRLSNPASELILSSRIILVAMPTAVLKPQLVGFESNFRQSTVGNGLMQTNPRLPAGWSGRALIRLAKSADWQPADLRIQIKVHMYSVNSNRLVDTLLANRLNSTHFSALINMSDYNRDDFEYSLSLTASFSEAGSFIRGQFLANVTIVPTFASAAALDSIVSSVVKSRDAAGLYSLTVTVAGLLRHYASYLSIICQPKCRSTLVAQYASTSLPNSTQNLVFVFDFVDYILTESNSDNNGYGIVSIVAKGLFDSVIDCRRDVEISRVLRNVYVDRRQNFTRVESTAENLRLKMLSVGDTDPVVIGYEHSDGDYGSSSTSNLVGLWTWSCYSRSSTNSSSHNSSLSSSSTVLPGSVTSLAIPRSLIVDNCCHDNCSSSISMVVNLTISTSAVQALPTINDGAYLFTGSEAAASFASGRFDLSVIGADAGGSIIGSKIWPSLSLVSIAQLTGEPAAANLTWEAACSATADCRVDCSLTSGKVAMATRIFSTRRTITKEAKFFRMSSIWQNISGSSVAIECLVAMETGTRVARLPLSTAVLKSPWLALTAENCSSMHNKHRKLALICDQFLNYSTAEYADGGANNYLVTPFTIADMQWTDVTDSDKRSLLDDTDPICTTGPYHRLWQLELIRTGSSLNETQINNTIIVAFSQSSSGLYLPLPGPGNYTMTVASNPFDVAGESASAAPAAATCQIVRQLNTDRRPSLKTSRDCLIDHSRLLIATAPPVPPNSTAVELLIGELLSVWLLAAGGDRRCDWTELVWHLGDGSGVDEAFAPVSNASIFHAYFRPGNYTVLLAFGASIASSNSTPSGGSAAERRLAVRVLPVSTVRKLTLSCLSCQTTASPVAAAVQSEFVHLLGSNSPANGVNEATFRLRTDAKFPLIALVNFGNGHSTDLTLPGPEAPMAAGSAPDGRFMTSLEFGHAYTEPGLYSVTVSILTASSGASNRTVVSAGLTLKTISPSIKLANRTLISHDYYSYDFATSAKASFWAYLSGQLPELERNGLGFYVLWDFGDGISLEQTGYATVFSSNHVYKQAGVYRLTVSLLSVVASKKSVLTSTSDLVNVIDAIESCSIVKSYSHTAADLVRLEGFIQPAGATTAAHWLVSTYHVSGDRRTVSTVCRPIGSLVTCEYSERHNYELKATASNQVSNATCRVDCYQLEAVRLHRFHPFRPLNFSTVQVGQPLEIQADPAVPCAVYNWSIVLDGVVQYFASTDEYHNRVVYNFSRAGTYTVTVSAVIGPFSVSDAGPVFALPAQQFCREPEQFVLYPKSQTLIDGQKIPVGFHDQLSSSLVFHPIINTEIETCGFHGNQSVSYTLLLRHLGTNFTRLIGPSVWPTMHLLPSNQPLGEYYAVAKATIVVVGNQQLQRQKIYAEQSFRALLQPSETWLIRLLPEAGVAAYRWVSRRAIDGVEATAQPLVFAIAVNPDRGTVSSLSWSCTPFVAALKDSSWPGCFGNSSLQSGLTVSRDSASGTATLRVLPRQLRRLTELSGLAGYHRYVFNFTAVDWRGQSGSVESLIEVVDGSNEYQLRLGIVCSTCSADYPLLIDPERPAVFRAIIHSNNNNNFKYESSARLHYEWTLFRLVNDSRWTGASTSLFNTTCTARKPFLGSPLSNKSLETATIENATLKRRKRFIPPISEGGGGEGGGGSGGGGGGTLSSTSSSPLAPSPTPIETTFIDSELRYLFGLARERVEGIQFNTESSEFRIPIGKLQPNRRYMISLSVVSLNAPKITGQAMESIVTTAGPFGGSCSIYNSNGTELLTDFSVSCGERQSFTTISPSGRPLQATHPFAYKFEYSANNERFVLAYAGPLPFFSLRLPAGFVLVKVTVCSAFGFCNSACEFQVSVASLSLGSQRHAEFMRQFSGDRLLLEAKSLNTAWLYHVGSLIWPRIAKQLLGTWPDVLANLTAHWISALASVGAYAIEANQTRQLVNLLDGILAILKTNNYDEAISGILLPCDSLAPGIVLAEALINNNSDHPAVVESTRRLMLSTVLSSSASDCQPLTGDSLSRLDSLLEKLPLTDHELGFVRRLTLSPANLSNPIVVASSIRIRFHARTQPCTNGSPVAAQLVKLPRALFPMSFSAKTAAFSIVEIASPYAIDARLFNNSSATNPCSGFAKTSSNFEPMIGIEFVKNDQPQSNRKLSRYSSSVSKFHRADIGLSVSYAGFSTGRLQIQLQFPAATGWVVPFDMNAVVNYRIVSTSHALIPAQSGVWSERISADSEHLVSIELPDYSLYDTLVANISISDASASSRLVSPMDALAQNFSVSVGLLACAYWHVTGADWRLDGCRAVPANSSTSDVECRCDHLTAFAVLRLGAAFGAGGAAARLAGVERLWLESGVSIVPFAIAACALLLSACLVKTTQWDSVHRRSPLTVVPLPDNCLATRSIDSYCSRIDRLRNQPRREQQLYLISVETGLSRFAGTNARVYATLHGPAGQSDHVTRELRQPPSDSAAAVPGRLFGPGCRSLFLLSAPRGLVEPRRVRLWHDAAGGDSPSWLLRRVDVCRLDDSGEMGDSTATLDRGTFFAFPCNAWLSAGSASLRTDRELHVGNGNDSCRSTLVDWLQLAWPALHPWLAPVYRPDWLGGCRTQCLLACSAWLAAVWAVAVALVTAWSSAEVEKKSLDYFPLHQDFIGGLPWAVGLSVCLATFSLITYCMPATRFSLRHLWTSLLSEHKSDEAQQPPQPPQPTQQQPPKTDPIIDFASLESIANFSHLQSWAEQAWQMRASWALADKLIGSSSGVGGGGSGSGAGSAFDDAISLDSIQMVLEGVRGTAATATASSAAANHGPVLTSPNGEPAAQAVYRGSQSALLFEFCSCAALLCLSVGFAVWAAVASWRFDAIQSSRTAALAVEFALTAGCLVSPLFCLIFAASRTLAGASVSGLKRSNAARLCRQAVQHYRQLVAVESRRPISESEAVSLRQRERQLRFAQPPSYAELANQRQQILAAYRGIRWAVRLAGGCLLAATLTALICGHSVAQSALAIDCATRAATIDEEPMRLRNFSAGQLLRSSIVQMVQCESCQWRLIGPPQLVVWSGKQISHDNDASSSTSSSRNDSNRRAAIDSLSQLLTESPILTPPAAKADKQKLQALSDRLSASSTKSSGVAEIPFSSSLIGQATADTWLWRSEADLIAYLPSAAWNVADLKSHTDWWSVMSKHLSAMLTTNSTAAVRAIGLTVSFYHASLTNILTTSRLLIEPNWFNNSWSADSSVVAFQREFPMLSSLALVLLLLYTAGQVAQLFAGLCSKRIHRRSGWEKIFRAAWLLSLAGFAVASAASWHLTTALWLTCRLPEAAASLTSQRRLRPRLPPAPPTAGFCSARFSAPPSTQSGASIWRRLATQNLLE
ncbi:hypothetical protein BOX15_Mlig014507g3, partial [Macrostomum lignano]